MMPQYTIFSRSYEPTYLAVRLFRDPSELQRAVEILHSYSISSTVGEVSIAPEIMGFQISVQPLFWEIAKEILGQFDTVKAYLIRHDSTMVWSGLLMIPILFLFMLFFPYERDPMTLVVFFALSLLPGIMIGQKRISHTCSLCGSVNKPRTDYCGHCGRKIVGTVNRRSEIPRG